MSEFELAKARSLSNVIAQNEIYKKKLRTRIKEIQDEVESTNKEVIYRRTIYHKRVVENLRTKSEQIYSRHQEVANRINKEAIKRDVNVRVNRGLESLEAFISVLRLSNWSDIAINDAIQDPVISSSPEEKVRRVTVSKFIKSIQRQLIEQAEFINIAAHELRTPIMPILVNAEILDQEFAGREEVRIIMRNALRLQRLAQNILDVARLNAGSLPLKKTMFDLTELICEAVQDESSRLNNRDIKLDFTGTEQVKVFADRDRISQVLSNLLGNAVKFTESGVIRITIEGQDDQVFVSVSDDGHGVDQELFPVLFTRFGKKSYSGTGMGLGLFISRNIVEAHGGKISARNNPQGKGAMFSFSLPLK